LSQNLKQIFEWLPSFGIESTSNGGLFMNLNRKLPFFFTHRTPSETSKDNQSSAAF
jgi:hypothetical protein